MQGDLTNAVPPPGTGAPLPIDGGVYLLRPSAGAGSLLEEVRKAIAVAGDAPVVVVTPAWDQETVSLALRAGAEDCLEESELHDPSTLRRLSTAVVRHRIRTGAVGESRRLWDHLARDIEGQPAASGALRASGQQLRAILENEPEGVLTVAADGTIIAVNHSGARLLEVEDPAALAGH